MLFPNEVKKLLGSPDLAIRGSAIRYLEKSFSQDPELVPLILRAWENHSGEPCADDGLFRLESLKIDVDGLRALIAAGDATCDYNEVFHLQQALISASPDVQATINFQSLPESLATDEVIRRIERRVEYARRSAEDLWDELECLCRETDETGRYANDMDHPLLRDLLDCLAEHQFPSSETLLELLSSLQDDPEFVCTWEAIVAVKLAGRRRMKEAIPELVRILHLDGDYVLERAADSLAQIADPCAVKLIYEQWPGSTWDFRNFASNVFSRIPCQESEDALLELISDEQDPSILAWLGLGLCDLFSARGLPIVRELIRAAKTDRFCADLRDDVLLVGRILDIEVPEADDWSRDLAQERQRRSAALDRLWGPLLGLPGASRASTVEDQEPAFELVPSGADEEQRSQSELATVTRPIRNTGRKVGRNDPCPCGSGRKFKKCCDR